MRVRWECTSFIRQEMTGGVCGSCRSRLMEVAAREGSRFIFKGVTGCEVWRVPGPRQGEELVLNGAGWGFLLF